MCPSPVVSVLLPVYNGEPVISRAIKSVLNQEFSRFELIIVENGSTDNSIQIIQSFDDPRIKVYQLSKPNLVEALNYGLKKSQTNIIARMDADDVCHPQRLSLQYEYLQQHAEIDVVSGLVKYVGDEEKNQGYVSYVNWANSVVNHHDIYLNRFKESALPHPTVMFRRKLIKEFGDYHSDVPEDFELWNRWLSNGIKVAKVDQVILDWHDSPHRLSRTNPAYNQEAFSEVKAQYFSRWFKEQFKNNPPSVYIFGHSKEVRRKTQALIENGLNITAFLDIKPAYSQRAIFYKELENMDNPFVLSYVSSRTGQAAIKTYLNSIGLKEGQQYLMME